MRYNLALLTAVHHQNTLMMAAATAEISLYTTKTHENHPGKQQFY